MLLPALKLKAVRQKLKSLLHISYSNTLKTWLSSTWTTNWWLMSLTHNNLLHSKSLWGIHSCFMPSVWLFQIHSRLWPTWFWCITEEFESLCYKLWLDDWLCLLTLMNKRDFTLKQLDKIYVEWRVQDKKWKRGASAGWIVKSGTYELNSCKQ